MKIIKSILLCIGCIVIALLVYYIAVIVNARMKTPALVQNALHSGRMKLELLDFTNDQLQALLKIQDRNFYDHLGFDITTPEQESLQSARDW